MARRSYGTSDSPPLCVCATPSIEITEGERWCRRCGQLALDPRAAGALRWVARRLDQQAAALASLLWHAREASPPDEETKGG